MSVCLSVIASIAAAFDSPASIIGCFLVLHSITVFGFSMYMFASIV